MKWTFPSLLFPLIVIAACNGEQKEMRPFRQVRVEAFLTKDAHQTIPTDTTSYLILEPDLCVSCVASLIREVITRTSAHPLMIIAMPDQADYILQQPGGEGKLNFITGYDRKKLSHQVFLQTGLAFARSWDHRIQQVEAIDQETVRRLQ